MIGTKFTKKILSKFSKKIFRIYNKENQKTDNLDLSTISYENRKELEDELKKRFWEIHNSQFITSKPLTALERVLNNPLSSGSYVEESKFVSKKDDWNKFNKLFSEQHKEHLHDLSLTIEAEPGHQSSIHCSDWVFDFKVKMHGQFQEVKFAGAMLKNGLVAYNNFLGRVDFLCAIIHKEFSFTGARFISSNFSGTYFGECNISFNGVEFNEEASFANIIFDRSAVLFDCSHFLKNTDFPWLRIEGEVIFCFKNCRLEQQFEFSVDDESKGLIKEIDLRGSIFDKRAEFLMGKVSKMNFEKSVFKEILALGLDFSECPDFSKSYSLDKTKLSVQETWKIDERNIVADEEGKFRFLKSYFVSIGNHFKEHQYFSYEMHAASLRIANDLKNQVTIKSFWDFVLFKLYYVLSNYGTSFARPLWWIVFCGLIFWNIFENYFQIGDMCAIVSVVAKATNPLYDLTKLSYCLPKDDLNFNSVVILQSLIDAVLLFLLLLGIRNKSKMK